MEVYLIRHTTPDTIKGICYGQTDLDIEKALFMEELKIIQSKLPNDIEQFYSSPLKRCKILTQNLANDYKTDTRLMELNFGLWEHKSWNAIKPAELNHWMADFVNAYPPEGENYQELHKRTTQFIETVLKTHHSKIAIVTHAGNIRSIISHILDLPLENSFRIHLNYGAIVHLQLENDKFMNKLISIQ